MGGASRMEAGMTIAGKYRLTELLGAGGMASVWSATNIFTDRQFAIKFMLPSVASTPEAAKRFLMEARVSARVNHPNVIEIIDVDRAHITEQHDQNGQTNRRFGSGDGEDEEHKNLPMDVAEVMREGDEVHVDRQQHQLDCHQQNDHVFAI